MENTPKVGSMSNFWGAFIQGRQIKAAAAGVLAGLPYAIIARAPPRRLANGR